ARTLLLPQLFPSSGYELSVFSSVRSLAQAGAVVLHRFPEQRLVHFTSEHLIEQLEVTDFLAREALDLNLRHGSTSLSVPAIDAAHPDIIALRYPVCSPHRG